MPSTINFSPGPSKLPEDVRQDTKNCLEVMELCFILIFCIFQVLLQVQNELIDYQSTGISVLEMSHRSPEFLKIVTNAQQDIRNLLSVLNMML